MSDGTDRITPDTPTIDEEFGTGWAKWNLQAFIDYLMVKIMMSRVHDVIPKTYVPILRLVSEDVGKVDEEYKQVVSLREPVRLFDSPRDRWRKMYGPYVRELDWVYNKLREVFPKREYEELVVDIIARAIREWVGAFVPWLEKGLHRGNTASDDPHPPGREPGPVVKWAAKMLEKALKGWLGKWLAKNVNPASFLVGPVEQKINEEGELEMYVPRCWMHTVVGDGKTHDEACVLGCKGGCEAVFAPGGMMVMTFEPHLPEFSCTIRSRVG
jgi:hypothetical protein